MVAVDIASEIICLSGYSKLVYSAELRVSPRYVVVVGVVVCIVFFLLKFVPFSF